MNKKPHFVFDIAFPLLAVVALSLISSFIYQMWVENNNILAAKENGAAAFTCQQIIKQGDLASRYVEVTDAKREKWLSIYRNKEGRFSLALLATPSTQNQDQNAITEGLIIQRGSFASKNECLEAAQNTQLTGLLRNSNSLDFKHGDNLSELFPLLDYSRCYVLVPNASGSPGTTQITIVMVIMMGTLMLFLLWSLITSTINAFKHGVRLKPEKDTGFEGIEPIAQVADTTFVHRETMRVQTTGSAANSPQDKPTPIQFADRPKCEEHIWLKVLMLGSVLLPIMAAATFFMGVWCPLGIDALLIFLSLGCWTATLFSFAKSVRNIANSARIPIDESSLPSSFTQHFHLLDLDLKSQGFEHHGTYATNLAIKQVTREYLESTGTTIVKITKTNIGVKAICCYSILANGQTFATIDIEIPPANHPLMGITTGVKGNLLKTLEIHDQIISQFEDVVLRISPRELDDASIYAERLEQQATGMVAYHDVPLPAFADLVWRLETANQAPSEMSGSLS